MSALTDRPAGKPLVSLVDAILVVASDFRRTTKKTFHWEPNRAERGNDFERTSGLEAIERRQPIKAKRGNSSIGSWSILNVDEVPELAAVALLRG